MDGVDGADGDAGRPRWRQGTRAAVIALGVALVVQGLVPLVLGDGLGDASGGAGQGRLQGDGPVEGLSITAGLGGWPLLAAGVVFVLVSRPWRLLRRRD